jgi:1-acyl-sn-glycerol-3-phosphate acyltransferase
VATGREIKAYHPSGRTVAFISAGLHTAFVSGGGPTVRYGRALAPVVLSAAGHVVRDGLASRIAGPSPTRSRRRFQSWCRAACQRLGISVAIRGEPQGVPCVYVANHRSYLDIVVLGSALGSAFLSRADVGGWPVIGAAARAIGTVFIDRDDVQSRARAARAIAGILRSASLIVFPEGTTGGGHLPEPFAEGVFRLLARLDAPAVPVTVRYSDRRAYWIDAVPMAAHLRERVLAAPLAATVHIGAPLRTCVGLDAAAFAAAARRAVCVPIEREGELAVAPRPDAASTRSAAR